MHGERVCPQASCLTSRTSSKSRSQSLAPTSRRQDRGAKTLSPESLLVLTAMHGAGMIVAPLGRQGERTDVPLLLSSPVVRRISSPLFPTKEILVKKNSSRVLSGAPESGLGPRGLRHIPCPLPERESGAWMGLGSSLLRGLRGTWFLRPSAAITSYLTSDRRLGWGGCLHSKHSPPTGRWEVPDQGASGSGVWRGPLLACRWLPPSRALAQRSQREEARS